MHKQIIRPMDPSDPPGAVYLDVRATAKLLGLSVDTLNGWRKKGEGPPYRKFGSRVLYPRQGVLEWAEAQ